MGFHFICFPRLRVILHTLSPPHISVCPGGTHVSALSQDPRTFQNTGTWPQNKHLPSVWFIGHSAADHTHKHTYKSIAYAYVWKRSRWHVTMKNLPESMQPVRSQKKMRTGKFVHTEIRYENAYRGGRNSFDLIRMVEKKQWLTAKNKRSGGGLNNS